MLGIRHDGAGKVGNLLATTADPVPVRVNVVAGNHPIDFGDAVVVVTRAFHHWLPLIHSLGVLSPNVPEDRIILDDLKRVDEYVKTTRPFGLGDDVIDLDRLPPGEQKLATENPAEFIRRRQAAAGSKPALPT